MSGAVRRKPKTLSAPAYSAFALSSEDAALIVRTMKQIEQDNPAATSKEQKLLFVEMSRPVDSETHHLFEWDPKKQSELYLYARAGYLINTVRVEFVEKPSIKVPAFVRVRVVDRQSYQPTEDMIRKKDVDLVTQMAGKALEEAENWRRRWQHIADVAELAGVFRAFEKLKTVKPPAKK